MNKTEKIRARRSYEIFRSWYNFLLETSNIKKILTKLHQELDNHNAYETQTMTNYAKESLEQLCKDKKIK